MRILPTAAQVPALRLGIASLVWALFLWFLPVEWSAGLTAVLLVTLTATATLLLWRGHILLAYLVATLGVGIFFVRAWKHAQPPSGDVLVQPFPAFVEGQIVDIIALRPPRLRCVVEGRLDAEPLPPLRTRVLMTISGIQGTEPWIGFGRQIRASVRVRPPRTAWLPTDFPERDFCLHLNVQWVGFARAEAVALWERPRTGLAWLWNAFAQQRQRLRAWLTALYPEDVRGMALALLLGDRSELTPAQRREFALSGVSHVLAISGLHIGIIAAMVLVPLGFVRLRWLQWMLFTIAVLGFVLITGAQPSALRAGLMASLGWGLYCLQRQPHPANIVAAVSVGMLLAEPELLFSRSFQLSVLATLGIVLLYQPFLQWLQRLVPALPRAVAQFIAVSLAAMSTSTPLAAAAFGTYSLAALPLNLVVVPLSSVAVVAGALGLLFAPVLPTAAELYSAAATVCLRATQWCVHWAAQLPVAAMEGPASTVVAAGVSVLSLWFLTAQRWKHVLARVAIAGGLIALGSLWFIPQPQPLLLPRERLVTALLPLTGDTLLAVLVDRFPQQKPRPDIALEQYLCSFPGHIRIAYSGPSAELVAVRCFRSRSGLSLLPAPSALEQYLRELFQLHGPLYTLARPVTLARR